MFEHYTEKARRVVFFARYECSQFGSPAIEPEHLLLGLLREDKRAFRWISESQPLETIRQRIESCIPKEPSIPTSVDLPLSEPSKLVLRRAKDEADRRNSKHIGTEHLFLALLRNDGQTGQLLLELGADLEKQRAEFSQEALAARIASVTEQVRKPSIASVETIEIHGSKHNADYIHDVVSTIRSYNWHWHKTAFKPRDIAIDRETGKFSFDVSLTDDAKNFELVKNGWKKDHCFVCRWELHESDDEHGTGYTNGRSWLCRECCELFVQKDFFSSSQSEMT